jgi:hypothetical protein
MAPVLGPMGCLFLTGKEVKRPGDYPDPRGEDWGAFYHQGTPYLVNHDYSPEAPVPFWVGLVRKLFGFPLFPGCPSYTMSHLTGQLALSSWNAAFTWSIKPTSTYLHSQGNQYRTAPGHSDIINELQPFPLTAAE